MEREAVAKFLRGEIHPVPKKIIKQCWREPSFSYRHRPRPDYGLLMPLGGRIRIVFDGGEILCRTGEVVFLPKGSHYEAFFDSFAEDYLVNFEVEGEVCAFSAPVLLGESDELSRLFCDLLEETVHWNHSSLRARGLFYLLLHGAAEVAESSPEGDFLRRAKTLLCSQTDLSLEEIARRLGRSPSGFRKRFKEETLLSPSEYRMQYKMERAKRLLESSELSVGQIAEELRFYDAATFCRTFRKIVGTTPLRYSKGKQL